MSNELFSFCYAMTQKNIIFLRRPSKKADFIIENIFEEVNIIDDKKIIELYFEIVAELSKSTIISTNSTDSTVKINFSDKELTFSNLPWYSSPFFMFDSKKIDLL